MAQDSTGFEKGLNGWDITGEVTIDHKNAYTGITLYNAGLPGATVEWGARYAEKYVSPLHPNLVIIDFGMNDFWTVPPERFKEYVKTIIPKVKAGNPHAEFILLSNLEFDPDYVSDTDKNKERYLHNMNGYNAVLQGLETTGVIDLDMTSLSGGSIILKRRRIVSQTRCTPMITLPVGTRGE
ncbi:MAG TPA: SGNH/GDSL hydrolase family protein [Chitinophagaceae bacterium]